MFCIQWFEVRGGWLRWKVDDWGERWMFEVRGGWLRWKVDVWGERWMFEVRGWCLRWEVDVWGERWMFEVRGGSLRWQVDVRGERWIFEVRGGCSRWEVDAWGERGGCLRWEVDIRGIVDHHCLNFLFIAFIILYLKCTQFITDFFKTSRQQKIFVFTFFCMNIDWDIRPSLIKNTREVVQRYSWIVYRYSWFGRGICEKAQSGDEKFPEPNGEL